MEWNFLKLEPWDNKWLFEKVTKFQTEFTMGFVVETEKIQLQKLIFQLKNEKCKITINSKLNDLVEDYLTKKIKKEEYYQILDEAHLQEDEENTSLKEDIMKTAEELALKDENLVFTKMKFFDEKIYYTLALLPVWICAYKFKNKVRRFLINGTNGEVVGDRPYSKIKLFFAWVYSILLILSLTFSIAVEYYFIAILIFVIAIFVLLIMTRK